MKEKIIKRINQLTNVKFMKLISKHLSTNWTYFGSMGKNCGDGALWIKIDGNYISVITSTVYGDDNQYFLAKETLVDLDLIKEIQESVIPFADCIQENDDTDDGISNVLLNIILSIEPHGTEESDNISNFDMSKNVNDFLKKQDYYTNLAFQDVAERYDIPFNN
tara:strand:- start:65 stop:556 length:492 start_codon:yes stop_codon:yes gene_type:complete